MNTLGIPNSISFFQCKHCIYNTIELWSIIF